MKKFIELSEEFLKIIDLLSDVSLKHPNLGGLNVRGAVNRLEQLLSQSQSSEPVQDVAPVVVEGQ